LQVVGGRVGTIRELSLLWTQLVILK